MSLPSGDWLVVLKHDAGMKATEIFQRTGMPTRSQSHEKSRSSRRSHHHIELRATVREKIPHLPWSVEAENVNEDIEQLSEQSSWSVINHRYKFFIDATKDQFDKIERAELTSISVESFGLVLVHYNYFTAMRLSGSSLCTDDVKDRFARAGSICLKLLEGETATWAVILGHRIATRRFGAIWNSTPRAERASEEMRALVEREKLFDRYNELNDLLPKNRGAPSNALAVASVHKERTRYNDLWRRLVRAAEEFKKPLDVKNDPYFDADFDDFRLWAANHPRGYETE